MTAAPPAAPQRSRAKLAAAALELGHEIGFSPAASITAAAAARAAGVGRATIYRHWDDVAALNDDLVRFGATVHRGWQRRVLEADPARPIDDTVRELIARPPLEAGLIFRCLRPQMRTGSPASDATTAWERTWLADFERWIDLHLAAQGLQLRGATTTAAIALSATATIEGALLLWIIVRGPTTTWRARRAEVAVAAVRSIFERATVPAARSAATPDDDGGARTDRAEPEPTDPLLAGVFYGLLSSTTDPSPPTRLIDADVLAERLGVSSRWIYKVWPTASDANADIVGALALQHRDRVVAVMTDAMTACVERPPNEHRSIVHHELASLIELAAGLDARSPLDVIATSRDPVVIARCAPIYLEWETSVSLLALAQVQSTSSAIGDQTPRQHFVTASVGAVVGAGRLLRSLVPDAGSSPERLDRLATAAAIAAASMTTLPPPSTVRSRLA